MTSRALTTLLDGLIDYAGLFPPAALSMEEAVRNYARYREGPYAWVLGRFVVPEDRVGEVPAEFPMSVLWSGGLQPADSSGGLKPAAPLEAKAATPDDVARIAANAGGHTVYVEITDLSLLEPIAKNGLRAKIRTGGVSVDAFARFIRACRDAGVAFKATAGLHHPLRGATMHGFVNVFVAAAMPDSAEEILREEDPGAFVFGDRGAAWRGHEIDVENLRRFAISFGSCSFEEPIADLKELGWLQ